ncbi:MAG: hypothetical protein WA906_13220 [Pacificimonas sp.]
MSLRPDQYLALLAGAQLQTVAPELENTYPGSVATTIGTVLIFAVQDAATRAVREAAERDRLKEIFHAAGASEPENLSAARDSLGHLHERAETDGDRDLERLILDHLVVTAEAALLTVPQI